MSTAAAKSPAAKPSAVVKSAKPNGASAPSAKELYEMIAQAAYYRAEKRGFAPGLEMDDWAQAEAEVRQRLGRA